MSQKKEKLLKGMFIFGALFGFMFFGHIVEARAASSDGFRWKYEVGARSVAPAPGRITLWAAQEIKKRSNGRLDIQVYFGTLGYRISNAIRTLGQGLIEGQHVFGDFVAGDLPLLSIMGLPGLIPKSNLALQKKIHEALYPRFAQAALNRNIVLLGGYQAPGRRIFTAKELNDLSELKGMVLRAHSPSDVLLTKSVGASPADIAFTETEMAIRRGTVDGIVTQDKGILDLNLVDFVKTCFDIDMGGSMVWFAFSKKAWDTLSPELQEIVREVCEMAMDAGWIITRITTDEIYDKYRKAGMKILDLTEDEKRVIEKGTARAAGDWIRRVGPQGRELLDIVKKMTAAQ